MDDPTPSPPPCPLTSWDVELLHLLASGTSVAAASEQLLTPMHAIAQRLVAIRGLYGVTSTAEAIHLAVRHRHLPPVLKT